MDNSEFRNLVKRTRITQIKYFATRSNVIKKKSIGLERLVDQELGIIQKEIKDQFKLF